MLKNKTVSIISCVKTKQNGFHSAKNLYTSPLFKKSYKIAKKIADEVFILSAEYGLINENKKINYYEKTLNKMSKKEYIEWCEMVEQQLSKKIKNWSKVCIFSGKKYRKPLEKFLSKEKISYHNFLGNKPLGRRLLFLKSLESINMSMYQNIREIYSILEHKNNNGMMFDFNAFPNMTLADKGVYIFLDPNEESIYSNSLPRIVRIGTHAIHDGAKSTIKQRLRAHYGTKLNSGNHRGSVFRKHIGNALLNKGDLEKTSETWGVGSNATKIIKDKEKWLELEVSSEIRKLRFCVFEIDDKASKNSKRSTIEKSLINILSTRNIDLISADWIGKKSPAKEIRRTGLWNIQHSSLCISKDKIDFLLSYLWNKV